MNNRKDSIYEIIVKYTRESILDNTFQFEHCNAFDIALELKIDRLRNLVFDGNGIDEGGLFAGEQGK